MEDVVLSVRVGENRTVSIAPLPKKTYRESAAKGLGGEYGYFIFETYDSTPDAGINVIGKAASIDAAYQLFDLIKAASSAR